MRPTLKHRPLEKWLGLCALVLAGTAVDAQEPPQPPSASAARPKAKCPPLEYPPAALRRSAEGVTKIQMTVDAAGNVSGTQLIRPSGTTPEHALLDEAAMKAAAACKLSMAEGAMPAKTTIDFSWRLGDSALPYGWPPANPGPLSNTSRAELLRQLYGPAAHQDEVDRCMAAQPEQEAAIQASYAAFTVRAEQALQSLRSEHAQELAEPVHAVLLDWLARRRAPSPPGARHSVDKVLCPSLVQRLDRQTVRQLLTDMRFDLSLLQAQKGQGR